MYLLTEAEYLIYTVCTVRVLLMQGYYKYMYNIFPILSMKYILVFLRGITRLHIINIFTYYSQGAVVFGVGTILHAALGKFSTNFSSFCDLSSCYQHNASKKVQNRWAVN